ncbi:PREDICTED: PIH1 domain-containing protein 2 [Nipponia nippon]|uniref:PIH1 domain-containing protein 2 n=1 Tax=Nipponia nippon TaxID=128390 RepID=UPI0005117FCE|nr:PREDICTED: PIH1 domain-containing protein 2 [Nipponia nippon]
MKLKKNTVKLKARLRMFTQPISTSAFPLRKTHLPSPPPGPRSAGGPTPPGGTGGPGPRVRRTATPRPLRSDKSRLQERARGAARPLFINVCSWKRVPAPKAPADPIPVSAGPLQEVSGEGGTIIDIAYNPDVLQRGEESPENMEHLILLTLKFVEERCNLILSYLYTIESFKLKGSRETMQQRLKGRQMPTPHLSQSTKKELTLDQLLHTMEAEDCSNAPVLLKEESVTQSKVHLIEEITSTEMPEKLSTPVYEIITVKDANKKPLKIELKIELPKVSSVSECDLRISKDDIIIEVPEKYKLQLDLPEVVDEETTTAVFHKGKRVLFITMPVAKPDP